MVNSAKQKRDGRIRRHNRLRRKIRGSVDRPRLAVFRSNRNIYAQIIDDEAGRTLVAASTKDKNFSGKTGGNVEAAGVVGKQIAEKAKKAGIENVIFDRGGYIYHGRVKALAEAAREAGLSF